MGCTLLIECELMYVCDFGVFHVLSGFISGLKMLLPENTKRKDTKEYEEVIIPKNEPAPLSVGNTRVQISDLDEVNIT